MKKEPKKNVKIPNILEHEVNQAAKKVNRSIKRDC